MRHLKSAHLALACALQVVAEALNLQEDGASESGAAGERAGDGAAGEERELVHLVIGGTQPVEKQLAALRATAAPLVVATPDRLLKILELADEGPGTGDAALVTPDAAAAGEGAAWPDASGNAAAGHVAPAEADDGPAPLEPSEGEAEAGAGKSSVAAGEAARSAGGGSAGVDVLGGLEVVVLDEVDRMLDSLSKYATDRDRKRRKRHPKKVAVLLERLAAHHNAAGLPLQLVACSATVGRPIRRDLAKIDDAWALAAFEIVRTTADEVLSDVEQREAKRARWADGGNGPASAGAIVPPTIAHQFVAVRQEEDKYAMLQYLLTSVCPHQPALLFLGDNVKVRDMVQKMRYSGIPRAEALHEVCPRPLRFSCLPHAGCGACWRRGAARMPLARACRPGSVRWGSGCRNLEALRLTVACALGALCACRTTQAMGFHTFDATNATAADAPAASDAGKLCL